MRCTLLLVLASVAAADPEADAQKLYARYLELRPKDDYSNAKLEVLRGLGRLDAPAARKALLRIAKTTRSADEKIVCVHSLAKVGDAQCIADLHAYLERKGDDPLRMAWADAMGRTAKPELLDWLAGEGLEGHRTLAATVEALACNPVPAAAPRLSELYARHEGSSAGVDVAAACGRALGALEEGQGPPVLAAAAEHGDWRVRQAVADVAPKEHREKLAGDAAAEVRRSLAAALGKRKAEEAVPLLANMLGSDPRLRNRYEAHRALQAIAGKDLGWDPAAWHAWHKERKEGEAPVRRTFARYYGFGVYSDRVVFVLDISGSMSWPWREEKRPKRIDVSRQQLARVLGELPPGTLFNLIVFSDRVDLWQKHEVAADEKSVAAALAWAERKMEKPDGDTHTHEALERAFERNPEFDTLFLLSDGNPSHGPYVAPEGILAGVAAMNRYRRAAIHTIALTLESLDRGMPILSEKPREMKAFMRDLASRNGGECEVVERPPPD